MIFCLLSLSRSTDGNTLDAKAKLKKIKEIKRRKLAFLNISSSFPMLFVHLSAFSGRNLKT